MLLLVPLAWFLEEGMQDLRIVSICTGINRLFYQKTVAIHNSYRTVECSSPPPLSVLWWLIIIF